MGLDGVMMSWTVVIPVKRLDAAKTRLGSPGDPRRPELALAFALDVIEACRRASSIGAVIVVTDDDEVIAGAPGVMVCAEPNGGGLNAAIRAGAALVDGPIVALAGDLPCLTAEGLDAVLGDASRYPRSLLSDSEGSGSAMLLAHDSADLDPHFGVGSRAAHVLAGFADLADDPSDALRTHLESSRRDVDTPEDLRDALAIGVGSHTAALLSRHA